MKIFYFTATGNSLDVAKHFDAELVSIPKMLKNNKFEFEDDKIGFIFPCFFSGLPVPVKNFIERSSLKADYFFAVITYGNLTGSTNYYLQSAAKKSGFSFDYINEISMVDNYVPLFDIQKEIQILPNKNVEEVIAAIKIDIESSRKLFFYKGIFVKIFSRIMQKIYKGRRGVADYKFFIDNKCDCCGICAKVCPVNNIKMDEKPEFTHKCEECFACLHNCPKNAIHHKKEKSSARFRNQNVALKDIIESNN